MVLNMSFYKWIKFGAILNRFSIKKKLNVKPLFFPKDANFNGSFLRNSMFWWPGGRVH